MKCNMSIISTNKLLPLSFDCLSVKSVTRNHLRTATCLVVYRTTAVHHEHMNQGEANALHVLNLVEIFLLCHYHRRDMCNGVLL
jgi:hypothetical protein